MQMKRFSLLLFCGIVQAGTVTVHVGDNWQTLVTANPAGTFFLIDSGIHIKQAVTPKARDTFCGAKPVLTWNWSTFPATYTIYPGAKMDGHDSTYEAFQAADSVFIKILYSGKIVFVP